MAANESACRLRSRSNSGTAGLHRFCALWICASCIAMADKKCCRPCHPQVHTARDCNEPRSTATTPSRTPSSDRHAINTAKVLAMSAATRIPHESSVRLVCQYGCEQRHGGQPNRLFPNMGRYSQIRSDRAVYYMDVPSLIHVASTPAAMPWANHRTDYTALLPSQRDRKSRISQSALIIRYGSANAVCTPRL